MHLDSNIVLQNIYSILGLLFWYGVIPFVIYQRVVSLYVSYFHYSRQTSKVKTMAVPLPFINDAIPLLPRFNNGENKQPITKWIEDALGGIYFNKTTILYPSHEPLLVIADVEVMESLYTTHNAHFDKHPIVQNLTLNLTGKSILFDESTPSWRQRRKGLSPAFYKGKLQGLIEISKDSVRETVMHLENLCK